MTSGKRRKTPGQCKQFDFASRSPDGQSQERHWRNVFRSAVGSRFSRATGQFSTPRSWLLAGVHLLVFAAAYWSAFVLRLDLPLPQADAALFWSSVGWVVGLQLLVFCFLGQFQGWWQYVTFADLANLPLFGNHRLFRLSHGELIHFSAASDPARGPDDRLHFDGRHFGARCGRAGECSGKSFAQCSSAKTAIGP